MGDQKEARATSKDTPPVMSENVGLDLCKARSHWLIVRRGSGWG